MKLWRTVRLFPWLLSSLLLGGVSACGGTDPEGAEVRPRSGGLTGEASWADRRAEAGVDTAERATNFSVQTVRTLYTGDLVSPLLSPSGTLVALSAGNQQGLSVLTVDGGALVEITAERRSGYRPVWSLDSTRLAVRAPEQSGSAVPLLAFDRAGRQVESFLPSPEAVFVDDQETIVMASGRDRAEVSPEMGERFVAPLASRNARFVVFEGLSTGLYLYDQASDRTLFLGPGSQPRFSADSTRLVFARQLDDGHQLTQSDLVMVDLGEFEMTQLTDTPEVLEVEPSLNDDGSLLAFRVGDEIQLATVTSSHQN